MSTVYVIQEPLRKDESGALVPRINYGTLTPFGTVRFVFSWGEIRDDMPLGVKDMASYMARARDAMVDYTEADYIVPMGHPALIAAVTLAAAERSPIVNLLDWSRERRAYRVVSMDVD